MGAAVATFLAYGGMMLLSLWIGQRKYPIPYPWQRIGGFLLLSTGLSLAYFYIGERNLFVGSAAVVGYAFLAYKSVKRVKSKKV